jgi:hypothetical protein
MTKLRPQTTRLLIVLVAIALLAGGYAIGTSRGAGNKAASPKKSPEFTTYTDPDAGFKIGFPSSWAYTTTEAGDPEVKLIAGPPGAKDYLLVRVANLGADANITDASSEDQLNALQTQLDALVRGSGVTEVLKRNALNIKGLPGWFYLYNIKVPATNEEGVHSHFFLFNGSKMIALVFQAVPRDDFAKLSGTFDKILDTFDVVTKASPSAPIIPAP